LLVVDEKKELGLSVGLDLEVIFFFKFQPVIDSFSVFVADLGIFVFVASFIPFTESQGLQSVKT